MARHAQQTDSDPDAAPPGPARGVYAHTLPDRPPEDWQPLANHLRGVARRAQGFSEAFEAQDWARLAGLWHDLGKYSQAFQAYLREAVSPDPHAADRHARTDHSTAGAQHAVASLGLAGHLLAFPIAGHHSGLLDSIDPGACLEARLKKPLESWDSAPGSITVQASPELPDFVRRAIAARDSFSVGFFVRMLFACLVDADFLDTEEFMNPEQARTRPIWPEDILVRMKEALETHVANFRPKPSLVNRLRGEVLDACLEAAGRPPGLFSLTVPTGGGKTLSSLAFALNHAVRHDLRRVIYVAPFTSIIEQNAEVFRSALASLPDSGISDPVIEHHSNLDPKSETAANRLATENWDAPLVVTTGVQFYESLFANRSSRCRKLHNLTRTVIVLDEAQALPVDFLGPCLRALDELARNYGATIVLCTATQPAVHRRDGFPIGLELGPDREIVPEPRKLYRDLKRVNVEREGALSDAELADRFAQENQVLCILNTRGHAFRLAERLGEREEHFHLSALMCPEHRSYRIGEILDRIAAEKPCRVVSTRLIEAGVDIDFPVVYRAMAGLDSIAQAAGRCNRNGKLPLGRTVVFEPEDASSERFMADTAGSARQVLSIHEDPLSLQAIDHYFRLYYWDQSQRWDAKRILDEFHLSQDRALPFLFGYRRAAARFQLIQEQGQAVIIPWGEDGKRLTDELRESRGPPVALRRRLQRYTVQVPNRVWEEHRDHAFDVIHDQYPVLAFPEQHYSESTGLRLGFDLSEALIT